jgi:hypothetical protein
MLLGLCGRSTYKLIWEEIVALYDSHLDQPGTLTVAGRLLSWGRKQKQEQADRESTGREARGRGRISDMPERWA